MCIRCSGIFIKSSDAATKWRPVSKASRLATRLATLLTTLLGEAVFTVKWYHLKWDLFWTISTRAKSSTIRHQCATVNRIPLLLESWSRTRQLNKQSASGRKPYLPRLTFLKANNFAHLWRNLSASSSHCKQKSAFWNRRWKTLATFANCTQRLRFSSQRSTTRFISNVRKKQDEPRLAVKCR